MRAKLTVAMACDPPRRPGDIFDGQEALDLVKAGFAVPIREEPEIETADAPNAPERAIRKPRAKK